MTAPDQAPCATVPVLNNVLPLCGNESLAQTKILLRECAKNVWTFSEYASRITYHEPGWPGIWDGYFTHKVCINSFGYCDNCSTVNMSLSNANTTYCETIGCVCEEITYVTVIEQDFGLGFLRTPGLGLLQDEIYIDLDSGNYETYQGNPNPFSKIPIAKKRNEKRATTVYISFNQPIVTVTPSEPTEMFIWASILSENEMIKCNNTCSFNINEKWLITTEILTINVYIGDVEVAEKLFNTTSITFCPIPNNPFSSIWAQSWDCMGLTGRFLLVCGYLGASVVLISLLTIGFKTFMCLWNNYGTHVYINMNHESMDNEIELEQVEPRKTFRDKVANILGRSPTTAIMFFMLFTVCSASVCTSSVVSNSALNTCYNGLNTKTCSYDLHVELALTNLGASSCIDLLDDEGNILKKITITYIEALQEVGLKKLYYTSDWLPMSNSKRICGGSVSHGNEQLQPWCNTWNNLTTLCFHDYGFSNIMECQGFNPADLNNLCMDSIDCLPGQNTCILGSNKGCGPFDYSEAYLFGRYAYLPVGAIYKVSKPEYVYTVPKIEIEIIADNATTKIEQVLGDGIITIQNVSYEIIGNLLGTVAIFGNNKIITGSINADEPVALYGTACEQNVPCVGSVGDIQSSFDTNFHAWTDALDQFIFPANAVQLIPKDGAIDFRFPRRGLNAQLPVLTKLPNMVNGELWTVSSDTLYINSMNPGPLILKLTTSASLTITENINTFCPVVQDMQDSHLVGCSNCEQGLVIKISAKSTCESGIMDLLLECSEGKAFLITHGCPIYKTDTDCIIRIRPTTELIKCDVIIKATSQRVHFEAVTPELTTTTNITGTTLINPDNTVREDLSISTESITNGFLDWFNNLTGWQGVIKWIVIALISTVVVALIVYLAFTLISCMRK